MPEIFGSASYYGIGKILKQYSKFPGFLPLPVNTQHGIVGSRVSEHDALRDAPENWFWDETTQDSHLKNFPGVRGRTVGAPFLYLLKDLGFSELPPEQREGTIVFPSHSSAFIRVSADFLAFAEQLNKLPDDFHPITVCAYHVDLDRGVYQPFIDKGFQIVTNGDNLYEKKFLENFVLNVKNKKYCIANHISTALYFSVALGVLSFRMGPSPEFLNKDPHLKEYDLNEEEQKDLEKFGPFFKFPSTDQKVQRGMVMQWLGLDHVLTREEMRKLLWANVLNKKYFIRIVKKIFFGLSFRIKRFFPKLRNSA